MSAQNPGWYQDPSSPDHLRYWDGVSWSNHTTPKKSPTAAQSQGGLAQAAKSGQPGQAGPPVPTTPMPQGSGWHGQAQRGQEPQSAPPVDATQPGWGAGGPTTTDGVPLSGYGKRVLARILDYLITAVIGIAVGWAWVSDLVSWYTGVLQRATDSGVLPDTATLQAEMSSRLTPVLIVSGIVALVYETGFLVWRGATPGKMAAGIHVRRTGRPGPLSIVDALKRQALTIAGWALGSLPVLSTVLGFVVILDYAWPLWDSRRQALHDKIADTQVVVGQRAGTTSAP